MASPILFGPNNISSGLQNNILFTDGHHAPAAWITGIAYNTGTVVFQSNNAYICLVNHTSGTFATDLTAGKWTLLGGSIPGDINQTAFSGANNQSSAADVTGLVFSNASARAFTAYITVVVSATSSLYGYYVLEGIQRGSDWQISQRHTGDDAQVAFSITNAGQVQYVSSNYAGFSSLTFKFRATVVGV